jgi:hypothetical protein
LLSTIAHSQSAKPHAELDDNTANPANVAKAIAALKSGDVMPLDLETIATARASEAIPELKKQFSLSKDLITKGKIADVLIRLGDKDDLYWTFLTDNASVAINDSTPGLFSFDEHGKPAWDKLSPAFENFVRLHGLSRETVTDNEMFTYPTAVAYLGETGDPRAIPLLRKALLSPNYMVEVEASRGLSEFKDGDSIQLIVDACKRAPALIAARIAKSLIYFDDPQAQAAAEKYIPADRLKEYRAARAAGESPYGVEPPAPSRAIAK